MGLAYTEHYLARGWRLVATCREGASADALASLAGGPHRERLTVEALDTADEQSIATLSERIETRIGNSTLDLVINNAGVSAEEAFGQWTATTFANQLRVNAIGPALVAQAIGTRLSDGAKLVNISSGMGSLAENPNPDAGLDAYAVSKAALNMVTVRLAAKLPNAIVVSLNPGWVRTEMGGSDATTGIDEAVATITQTIKRLTLAQTGRFLTERGEPCAW